MSRPQEVLALRATHPERAGASRGAIKQAALLATAAILAGLAVNAVHPRGVRPFSPVPPRSADDPRYLSLDATRDRLREGRVLILDVRQPEVYEKGHIEGAWNLPASAFDQKYPELARFIAAAPEVIVYCDRRSCTLARDVADRLNALSVSRVRIFEGGWEEWTRR